MKQDEGKIVKAEGEGKDPYSIKKMVKLIWQANFNSLERSTNRNSVDVASRKEQAPRGYRVVRKLARGEIESS